MRNAAVLGDDDNAVPDVIKRVVQVIRLAGGGNHDIVANAGIFIDNGVFDPAVAADADAPGLPCDS